jgi:hypothetical protein
MGSLPIRSVAAIYIQAGAQLMHIDSGYKDSTLTYFFKDKGYPLLNWVMTSIKEKTTMQPCINSLQPHHCRGRNVVENTFRLLKENQFKMSQKEIIAHHHYLLYILFLLHSPQFNF